MAIQIKRAIKEVLNYETGECIDANEFFKKPLDELVVYRSELQRAIEGIRESLFVCYYCKQKIRIRGGTTRSQERKADVFHFAHLKDSDECHIKTKNKYSKEEIDRIKYNGAKESKLHQSLKYEIAYFLTRNAETKKEMSSIEVEKIIRNKIDKEWKKPDINAFYNGKRIAIELQLSTTWLDVITRRQHFYKEQGIYILWIFHAFNINDDVRKLTYNDVIYTNNQNAYVFDEEAIEVSKAENDLTLKCYYKSFYKDKNQIFEAWENSFVKLSDLTFDDTKTRLYYKDAEQQKKIIEKEIRDETEKQRESDRIRNLKETEQIKRKLELQNKIENLKNRIKEVKKAQVTLGREIDQVKRDQNELKQFESRVTITTDQVISYFNTEDIFRKPFYEYDELLSELKNTYSEKVKSYNHTIKQKLAEQAQTLKHLANIRKLNTIQIGPVLYSIINPSTDWAFIKSNYSRIKTVDKNSLEGLFPAEGVNLIKTEFELNTLQYSKNILFLNDFSDKIKEINSKHEELRAKIQAQESLLNSVRKQIKSKIEEYVKDLISNEEIKLKECMNRNIELSNELNDLENRLKILI